MRTKVIIEGFRNTQKFRAIINGVMVGDCQIKDLVGGRFPQREQRVAVWDALMVLASRRRLGLDEVGSVTRSLDGIDVQVDLV